MRLDAGMDGGIADDAAFADFGGASLELGFDERDQARGGGGEREWVGEDRRKADEAGVADKEGGRGVAQLGGGQVAGIHLLEHGDPRVTTQPPIELAVADVDREH